MRIENIIEDIKKDITVLSEKLQEQLQKENPCVNFSISMPGLEELKTIKCIALTITEGENAFCFSVHIHTHNGNRVFENTAQKIIQGKSSSIEDRHPLQVSFVSLLRDIIKKNKHKVRYGNKPGDFFNEFVAVC